MFPRQEGPRGRWQLSRRACCTWVDGPWSQFGVWPLNTTPRCFGILSGEQTQPPSHQQLWFLHSEPDGLPFGFQTQPWRWSEPHIIDLSCCGPHAMSQGSRKPPGSSASKSLSPLGWGRQKFFLCSSHFLTQLSPSAFPRQLSVASTPIRRELERQQPSLWGERWPGPRMSWLSTMLIV